MTTTNTETLNKALMLAVENDNVELIQWIFTQGMPTNIKEAMKTAKEKDQKAVINELTQHNVSNNLELVQWIFAQEKTKEPALPSYEKGFAMDMVKSTIKMEDNSYLMMMIDSDSVKAYQELLEGKYSVEHINHQNSRGWTALHYICRNYAKISNAKELIKKLVELGADINLRVKCGLSVITQLCYHANIMEIMIFLLDQPKIDLIALEHGIPIFHHLCRRLYLKYPEMIDRILKKIWPHINMEDDEGYTLFERMCAFPHRQSLKLIEMLLRTGQVSLSLKRQFKILAKMSDERRDALFDLMTRYIEENAYAIS